MYHTACMKISRYPNRVNTTVTLQGVNSASANEREAQSCWEVAHYFFVFPGIFMKYIIMLPIWFACSIECYFSLLVWIGWATVWRKKCDSEQMIFFSPLLWWVLLLFNSVYFLALRTKTDRIHCKKRNVTVEWMHHDKLFQGWLL